MLKAIAFDYNGVLIDDLSVHEDAYIKAGMDFGFSLTREVHRRYFSTTPEKKRVLYFGEISDETWKQLFERKTRYYFEMANGRNLLFPKEEEVLFSLYGKYRLGVVSNTPRIYFEKVFPPELARLFQEMIFGDEVANPKPSPEPLREMMRRMGVAADECCYVGDSVSDILMAKQAGVRIFVVTTGDGSMEELRKAEPDGMVENLPELEKRLEGL